MIRPVIGTIATRVFVMLMNIAVIMIAGHRLGASGLGDISLVVLGITFILLLSNVIGGGAIVYLLPRHSLKSLLIPSYAWAVISALVAFGVVAAFPLTPEGTGTHVVILAMIQSVYTIHFNVLLGRQRIKVINMLQFVHAIVLLVTFAMLIDRATEPGIMDYIHACYFAYGITALGSILMIAIMGSAKETPAKSPVLGRMLRQGGAIQIANFLQLLNYRLAYYLLERYQGLAALGIYSVGNQLAESAWLGPKSIGSVLYGRVSNTTDPMENERLTITAAKVAGLMAALVLVVVVLVPDTVYQWLFGPEIVEITELVLLLAPGILAMAVSQALSHYYSGSGRNIHNVAGSGIGVLSTMACGFWLIPVWGVGGAAITASIAYSTNVLYQMIVFMRTTNTPLSRLGFDAEDRRQLIRIFKRLV